MLGEDRFAVLARHRCFGARRVGLRRQHAGQSGHRYLLRQAGLVEPLDQPCLADLRLLEEVGVAVQPLVHQLGRRQAFAPMGRRLGGNGGADDGIDCCLVGEPQGRRRKAGVLGQRWHVHRRAQAHPVAVVDGDDRHPAVGRPEHAARHATGLHGAAFEMAGHQPDRLQRRRGLHQADIDVAPRGLIAAGIERRAQRLMGIERGRHIDHNHRHAVRDAVLAAVLRHHAGIGLQHRIHRRPFRQRSGLAEARDRDVEQARLAGRHRRVVEAQPPDDAGTKALEEHVGAREQAPQHLLAGLALEVERDAALAEIADDREGSMAAVADAERACPVAVADAFDLDHLGTLLGQQHGAVGPGNTLAEIDDLEAGEGRVVTHGVRLRPA